MASRKLVRDFLLSNRVFNRRTLISQQVSNSSTRLRLLQANGYLPNRQFSAFNEFSKQVKGEANRRYQEFQQSVKELKDKAEGLKGVTEDLKGWADTSNEGLILKLANAEQRKRLRSYTSKWMVYGRRLKLQLRRSLTISKRKFLLLLRRPKTLFDLGIKNPLTSMPLPQKTISDNNQELVMLQIHTLNTFTLLILLDSSSIF